jgi:hypothetical protein
VYFYLRRCGPSSGFGFGLRGASATAALLSSHERFLLDIAQLSA